jgi:hypothetical protein
MLAKSIFLAFALSTVGIAQEIDNGDVPNECRAVCASIVTLATQCDNQFSSLYSQWLNRKLKNLHNLIDNDGEELNCICSATGVSTQLPLCEACVAQFDNNDDNNDNGMNQNWFIHLFLKTTWTDPITDINELLRSCSFTTTSYNPSAASASVTNIGNSTSLTTPAPTNAQSTGTPQSTSTDASSPTSSGGDDRPAEQTETGAAPMPTVGVVGVGLGVLGLAMGIM